MRIPDLYDLYDTSRVETVCVYGNHWSREARIVHELHVDYCFLYLNLSR